VLLCCSLVGAAGSDSHRCFPSVELLPLRAFPLLFCLCAMRWRFSPTTTIVVVSNFGGMRGCVLCRPRVDIRVSAAKVAAANITMASWALTVGLVRALSTGSCCATRRARYFPSVLWRWISTQHWVQSLTELIGSSLRACLVSKATFLAMHTAVTYRRACTSPERLR